MTLLSPGLGYLLVSDNSFPEPGCIWWVPVPADLDVRAGHDAVVGPLLVDGERIELFPAELASGHADLRHFGGCWCYSGPGYFLGGWTTW